jgi:hypothetical protein
MNPEQYRLKEGFGIQESFLFQFLHSKLQEFKDDVQIIIIPEEDFVHHRRKDLELLKLEEKESACFELAQSYFFNIFRVFLSQCLRELHLYDLKKLCAKNESFALNRKRRIFIHALHKLFNGDPLDFMPLHWKRGPNFDNNLHFMPLDRTMQPNFGNNLHWMQLEEELGRFHYVAVIQLKCTFWLKFHVPSSIREGITTIIKEVFGRDVCSIILEYVFPKIDKDNLRIELMV